MRDRPLGPDLLEQAVALWNRCLGERFPMRAQLLRQNLWDEPNFDPEGSRAHYDGDRLIALSAVKRHQVDIGVLSPDQRGWISVLLVDPDYQGRGIGSALLRDAIAHLRRYSAERIGLGADPSHFFPGIPLENQQALDWFARRGARPGGLVCDLASHAIASYQHPPAAEQAYRAAPGIAYRPATEGDLPGLQAFMQAEFPDRWAWEIERYVERGGLPGDVMLALSGDQVVGFARIHTPESGQLGPASYWAPRFPGRHGGVGPIGVAASQRGQGVGLGLLSAAIAELRERGVESGVIDWTTLVGFYGKVGFRPWTWYVQASLPEA